MHDLRSGRTVLVSRNNAGAPANLFAGIPSSKRALSRGGRVVAFSTAATNLPGGGSANELVYVRAPLSWPR